MQSFDARNGSWGGAPKFPQPMTIEYLLRRQAGGDPRFDAVARFTLDKMADGGIHDQLGGGFHRYSTDPVWLVPHFEQMLYDNAQLARVYLHAWALTGETRYRDVATGTLDYMIRELTTDDGAFAASQDADTEGVEGLTFVWSAAEIREVLGDDAEPFMAAYGVTEEGNWEGRTILSRVWPEVHTPPPSREDAAFEAGLAASRAKLLGAAVDPAAAGPRRQGARGLERARDRRLRRRGATPASRRSRSRRTGIAWRRCGRPTRSSAGSSRPMAPSRDRGRTAGRRARASSRTTRISRTACSRCTRRPSTSDGSRPPVALMDRVLARFADPAGGFFDTADDHERLVARPKDLQDNAVPSGNSVAALVLLRLAAWTGEGRYRDAAERALRTVVSFVDRYPTGFAQWLSAMDLALAPAVEVAIVGEPGDAATQALLGVVETGFRPHQVVAASVDPAASVIPLLADRVAIDGRPTAYVCRGFVCRLPVTDVDAFREQLAAGGG